MGHRHGFDDILSIGQCILTILQTNSLATVPGFSKNDDFLKSKKIHFTFTDFRNTAPHRFSTKDNYKMLAPLQTDESASLQ